MHPYEIFSNSGPLKGFLFAFNQREKFIGITFDWLTNDVRGRAFFLLFVFDFHLKSILFNAKCIYSIH